jgi:hypothetical protein
MDVYLLRIDADGDTLWTNTYDFELNDYGATVKTFSYWGYVVTGYVQSPDALDYNVLLMEVHHLGGANWSRFYGGPDNDTAGSIEIVSTGGYIIAGITKSFGAGSDDVYLIRTKTDGDTLWTATYGGVWSDWGVDVEETADEGFVICGLTNSFGHGAYDLYLVKTGGPLSRLEVEPRPVGGRLSVGASPNPAASTVAINYALTSAGRVNVVIYDPLGREVRRLGAGTRASGPHTISWDRTDERGVRVGPGVYHCRVEAGGQSAAAKITLID